MPSQTDLMIAIHCTGERCELVDADVMPTTWRGWEKLTTIIAAVRISKARNSRTVCDRHQSEEGEQYEVHLRCEDVGAEKSSVRSRARRASRSRRTLDPGQQQYRAPAG